jgi:hypothetical protein
VGDVALRVITLLLAVIMMMTAATSVSASDLTSADPIASIADDTPDMDTPVVPTVTPVVVPDRALVSPVVALAAPTIGRMHAVTVFRPPRAA